MGWQTFFSFSLIKGHIINSSGFVSYLRSLSNVSFFQKCKNSFLVCEPHKNISCDRFYVKVVACWYLGLIPLKLFNTIFWEPKSGAAGRRYTSIHAPQIAMAYNPRCTNITIKGSKGCHSLYWSTENYFKLESTFFKS